MRLKIQKYFCIVKGSVRETLQNNVVLPYMVNTDKVGMCEVICQMPH